MSTPLNIVDAPQLTEATTSLAYRDVLSRLYERAAATFATPTARPQPSEPATPVPDRTTATAISDPEVIAEFSDSPQLRAIEELRAWLQLSYREVATIAGFGSPSLIYHWRDRHRLGHPVRARASTLERLWRVHALSRAIAEALEGADQGYAASLWVRRARAGVTPLELLLKGDVDLVERQSRELLFPAAVSGLSVARTAALEEDRELELGPRGRRPTLKDDDFG
jgi:hypothetical protein